MPTPVPTARQCLTAEAADALDAAVAVARRRTHSQTTSLHAVSALLAPSHATSLLRDACSRAGAGARLRLRAVDLSLAVALDRLASSQTPIDEPPVSNSLMAAIKRSQAIQRRTPDSHRFLPPPLPPPESPPVVLVELRQLVLSILDDPVVSRVFFDAGVRSSDVKLAVLRPPPPGLARTRFPPLFLCNFAGHDSARASPDFDDACRRILDVLLAGRNAFLVGSSARDAVISFRERVNSGGFTGADSSPRFSGVGFVAVGRGSVGEAVREAAGKADGGGVVVDVGDLTEFPADCGEAVAELTGLVERRGRVWLIGSAANYETYMKFMTAYPAVEKDWNLQLLPITSFNSGIEGSRPSSLMQSFVPFGGFFSSISDFKSPVSSTYQPALRCKQCDEKYEEELSSILKSSKPPSPQQPGLPLWLQKADVSKSAINEVKAGEDETHLRFVTGDLQKKWTNICLRLHGCNEMLAPDCLLVRHTPVSGMIGFPLVAERTGKPQNHSSSVVTTLTSQTPVKHILPSLSKHEDMSLTMPESQNDCLSPSSMPKHMHTKYRQSQVDGFGLHSNSFPAMCTGIRSSLSTSLTMDLRLGTNSSPLDKEDTDYQNCKDRLNESSQCSSSIVDSESIAGNTCLLSSSRKDLLSPASVKCFDSLEMKSLCRKLIEKVGRQEGAIHAISRTIAHCKSGNQRRGATSFRGDIWLNFSGQDKVGKKKVARAIAELMFGSSKNFIYVDLRSQHSEIPLNSIVNIGEDMCGYGSHIRGQTAIDHIAGELRKKPLSVVFLDNVHQADMLVQKSLSCALKTGMLSDSHGRQVGIKNTIFVTTTEGPSDRTTLSESNPTIFRENGISSALKCRIHMQIENSSQRLFPKSLNVIITCRGKILMSSDTNFSNQLSVHKRKLEEREHGHNKPKLSLDLNLTIEEMEHLDEDDVDKEKECRSESSEAWIEEFHYLVDAIVDFEPYDFHSLAQNVLKVIAESLRSSMGSEAVLDIDIKCMEHLLAAAWACEKTNGIEDWINNVLSRCFVEAKERCKNPNVPVFKLVSDEDGCQVEQLPHIWLPARIALR